MAIRPARMYEAEALDRVAMAAKAHWGYSAQDLARLAKDLATPPDAIAAWPIRSTLPVTRRCSILVGCSPGGCGLAWLQLQTGIKNRYPWRSTAQSIRALLAAFSTARAPRISRLRRYASSAFVIRPSRFLLPELYCPGTRPNQALS